MKREIISVITTFVLILSSHFSMIYALDKPHLNLNEKEDEYYSFENSVNIYEYDESGRQFQIAHMEPFSKMILSFDESHRMRERYNVSGISEMTNREIDWIYNTFVKPINWR